MVKKAFNEFDLDINLNCKLLRGPTIDPSTGNWTVLPACADIAGYLGRKYDLFSDDTGRTCNDQMCGMYRELFTKMRPRSMQKLPKTRGSELEE